MAMHLRRWAAALAVIGVLAGSAVSFALTPTETEGWEEYAYVLGEYSGRVAVFEPAEGRMPCQVTDIRVGLLPASDRARLQEGIPLRSRLEVILLLEDLSL